MTAKESATVATLVEAAELCERVASRRSESKIRIAAPPKTERRKLLLARFDAAISDVRRYAEDAPGATEALKLLKLLSELEFLRQCFDSEPRAAK
jgi:hypothetical protein